MPVQNLRNELVANQFLNYNHRDFFQSADEELIFYGSAGSGKSYSIADKFLIQAVTQPVKLKFLVVRKTLPSLKRTCIPLIEQRANLFRIPYKLNRGDFVAKVGEYGSEINYVSMNHQVDYEKVKSITDLDYVWIEEANELAEEAYDLLRLRVRGGQARFDQIICSFNPVSTTSWLFDRFFVRNLPVAKFHTTVYDNPFIEQKYIDKLEALKDQNYNLYKVYCLGEWGTLKGVIYNNYDIVELYPAAIDEIIYGLDFGFNNEMALVKIYMSDGEPWLEEKLYQSGLTTPQLIQKMKRMDINRNDPIYCDNEPDRIKEICEAGFNAKPAFKGPDSVEDGIFFVQTLKMHVMSESTSLIKELGSYSWAEDKDGNTLDEPVKFQDHLCDAFRMALYTHLKKSQVARLRVL